MRLALTLVPALLLAPFARARADGPPVFGIPFGCGLTFPISQTHNTGSHEGNDAWAWDFRMPVGTPVVAAAAGVVRMARGDSKLGACDPAYAQYANYVVIDHPDGYETQYLHFSKVVVKPGDHVAKGQLIGYSGETGWACGAHLHFKVARPVTNGWNNPSVPARLKGYGDPALETLVSSPACKSSPMVRTASSTDGATKPTPRTRSAKAPLPADTGKHVTPELRAAVVAKAERSATPAPAKGKSVLATMSSGTAASKR